MAWHQATHGLSQRTSRAPAALPFSPRTHHTHTCRCPLLRSAAPLQSLTWVPDDKGYLRDVFCRWVPAYSKALLCHLRYGADISKELEVRPGGRGLHIGPGI